MKYDDAVRYLNEHRNIGRPTYNHRRLKERPLPSHGGSHSQDNDLFSFAFDDSDDSDEDISIQNDTEQSLNETVSTSHQGDINEMDVSVNEPETTNDNVSEEAVDFNSVLFNEDEHAVVDPLTPIKREVPLYEICAANNAEIDELLDEPTEFVFDDDVTIIIGKCGVPKPWAITSDTLIKRQNDAMSGNIAFNSTVSVIFVEFYKMKLFLQ